MAIETHSASHDDGDKELNAELRRELKRQLDGIVEPLAPWLQDDPPRAETAQPVGTGPLGDPSRQQE